MINWTPELEKEYSRFSSIHKSIGLMSDESIIKLFKELKCAPPEQPSKEWEILSIRVNGNLYHKVEKYYYSSAGGSASLKYLINHTGYEIEKVKRFNDGQIFSVGDEFVWPKWDDSAKKITSFHRVTTSQIDRIVVNSGKDKFDLPYIVKKERTQETKPRFTKEDIKKITDAVRWLLDPYSR